MSDFNFSYSFGTYDAYNGFNSIGGSGYAGQNISYEGTNATGFDAFTSNPFVTNTTTTGYTLDLATVGAANYQIGVDYTNNAVTGFANPNTGGTQALSLDNTYYNIVSGNDAYLTTQFNKMGSIATIQTATATVIANTQFGGADDTYVDDSDVVLGSTIANSDTTAFDPTADFTPSTGYTIRTDQQGDLTVTAADYQSAVTAFFNELRGDVPATISQSVEEALITTQTFQSGTSTIRVIGPGIDVYNNQAQTDIDVAGRSQSYYDRIQEIAFSQADGDPAFAALVRPADFGFDLATETFASDEDAELYSLAVQQRVVDVITTGLTGVDNALAISQQLVAQNPDIFSTVSTAATGETYYTLKSLFEIRQTLEEVSQDPAALQAIRTLITAAGSDISKADLRAANVIAVIQATELNTTAETVISAEAQSIINQRVSATISQTGTITAAEYAQIQQQVVSSTLIQTQTTTVDEVETLTINDGGGGGGGGGGAEDFGPTPVSTAVDPQAGGSGGFGDEGGSGSEDPPLDEILFSSEDVSLDDPAADEADAADAEFTGETVTGLRTVPEDQFVETDGGLYVLEDEVIPPDEIVTDDDTTVNSDDPNAYPNGTPYDDDGNLNPGWAINPETGEPYFIGGDYIDPSTIESANASREAFIQSQTKNAQAQAAIQAQRKQANEGDWRVKLRLAGSANYLYKDPEMNQDGILWPLNVSDGVVFPYTPQIQTTYGANYNAYDLTHSNYRGYFYQNSYVDEIQIQATFTAQDTSEANYMLAVIHFFKSVTKMFYGQDAQRGMPPPLVFLQGLGEYQFNLHPCVVKTFNYQLPNNVDYIRARSVSVDGTDLLKRRDRQTLSTSPSLLQLQRLMGAGLQTGALTSPQAPPTLGTNNPTYVPTKIDISLGLLPIQSRSQVSKQFSVKQFANGDLLKGGFW